ncbi:SLATT domain-containing protein [Lentisphaerae bacterium WC36]|nr:SLATT domain-containing protein [Lentisphaerae bacterium WC36]
MQHRLSTRSVACVTSYLIIYSIMDKFYPGNDFLSIIIIFLSIWILVFSLLEERGNYQIEAIDMDECANKINQLYNRLRFCKSYLKNQEKIDEIKNISDEYRDVLKRYKKYHKINWFLSLMYKIKIYIVTRLKYDFVIIIPLVYLIYLIFTEMLKK